MPDLFDPPAMVRPAEDLAALAARANAEHEAGERLTRKGLEHYRAAGEALRKAKAQCGHGKWLAWLKANVKFSQQQASRYMQLAKLPVTSNLEDQWRVISGNVPPEDEDEAPDLHAQEEANDDAAVVHVPCSDWTVDCAHCLDWFAQRPPDSIDLVFCSPPYEDRRRYLQAGQDLGIACDTGTWVARMLEAYKAALRCCTGVVAFVVQGPTKDYRWTAGPALLMADLTRAGITLRNPPIFRRVGIPGSGGPDWLRSDYEFVVCATRGDKLPWSDNTAMGHAPKYEPGGDPSHRQVNGERVNRVGYATMADRNNVGPHRARQRAGRVYEPPERCNPGNVIDCVVGGGSMGDPLCHENEAPFPECLAEFFIRSFCPPGGTVCDPFCGSGTTGAVAVRLGRRFAGCDIRASQVRLTQRRLSQAQPPLPLEVA
jgi:hypothetical protein